MNGYYHGETASTLCETSSSPAPEPIPDVLSKANVCLSEADCHMQEVYKLLFGDEPIIPENDKCDNVTQMANNIAKHAGGILTAVRVLRERLGG